jgi:hypothetical protein
VSHENMQKIRPFFSLLLVISTLFSIVFLQLEIRRVGYSVLKLSSQEKQMLDRFRSRSVDLAKISGPQSLRQVAKSHLPLRKAQPGQIIQMTEQGIVIIQ